MDEYDNECDIEMVSLDSLLLLQCVEFEIFICTHCWQFQVPFMVKYMWAITFLGLISYFENRLTILSMGDHGYYSWVYLFLAVKIKFCIVST